MKNVQLLFVVVIATLAGAGPVHGQAPTAPVDPVGMYDFDAVMGIQEQKGTLQLERNPEGQLVGEARLEGESDPAIIGSGVVTGNHVELSALVNNSLPVTFVLDFTGSEFEGVIVANSDSIAVYGTRRN